MPKPPIYKSRAPTAAAPIRPSPLGETTPAAFGVCVALLEPPLVVVGLLLPLPLPLPDDVGEDPLPPAAPGVMVVVSCEEAVGRVAVTEGVVEA